jgi:hypothetical protein
MRVMTWNLLWRFGDDWRARGHGILSTLQDLRPDIAGLQEVWATAEATQAAVLADRLGMHSAYGAPSLPPPPRPPERPDQAGVGRCRLPPLARPDLYLTGRTSPLAVGVATEAGISA